MDLRIERQSLMRSLSHVQSVVERRNTIPILSNVLIECGDGAVTLTATDMDLTLTETTGASVPTSGAVTAPAHMLFDIVRKLPDGVEVGLTKSDGSDRMTLTAGKARFELSTLPREDYPALDGVDLPISFEMPAEELKTLIERTRFAISTEETRYYLNGIYLHAMGEGASAVLRAVATDGHRLADASQCDRTLRRPRFAFDLMSNQLHGDLITALFACQDERARSCLTIGQGLAGPDQPVLADALPGRVAE